MTISHSDPTPSQTRRRRHPAEAAPGGAGAVHHHRIPGHHHSRDRGPGRGGRGNDLPPLQRQGGAAPRGLPRGPELGAGAGGGRTETGPFRPASGCSAWRAAGERGRQGSGHDPDAAPPAGRGIPRRRQPGRPRGSSGRHSSRLSPAESRMDWCGPVRPSSGPRCGWRWWRSRRSG